MDLVICEIFNDKIHGFDDDNDPTVLGHYLVLYNFTKELDTTDSETNSDTDSETTNSTNSNIFNNTKFFLKMYKNKYTRLNDNLTSHPFIRNYKHIITRPNYIQLHIAKIVYLNGLECVAILKTFWLKLIQRTWKKIYKQRCTIIALRKSIISLVYKEISGKWPDNCTNLPSLKGMMSSI